MDAMAEIRQTFFIECEELLEAMDTDLTAMSNGEADDEAVNAVFRAVHSIKGGAGAFALEDLVRFAHKFETTMDEVRAGRLEPGPEVMKVFLRAGDILADVVYAARDDAPADVAAIDGMLAELAALTGGTDAPAETPAPAAQDDDGPDAAGFMPITLDFGDIGGDAPNDASFMVQFKPHESLYTNGNETGLLLRALGDIGSCETTCDWSGLPAWDDIKADGAYLSWAICVHTDEDKSEIEEVFEFVEGACDLSIDADAPAAPEEADPTGFAPIAIDIDLGDTAPEPSPAPDATEPAACEPPAPPPAAPEAPKPAAEKKAKEAPAAPKATVRVDLERVDRLINLVGELVINQAMLTQCVQEADDVQSSAAVENGLDEFKQLTRDIQESVMAIRAQPVKPLFQRMSRIVREASNATGKDVRLELEGEGTEVDKTVVERLSDPLTHMIRNAVDHGLESTEKRVETGKSSQGTVTLTAAHRSGRVIIEVADDGGGINRERVKAKAIENGLIAPDADLSPSEIDNLLFMPGFSTASAVSDLSGRGVGMDVVKRAIQALGGRIAISSEEGKGTTFSISLPLTLAVLDGMVVRVKDQTLVVPLTAIGETFRPSADDLHQVADTGTAVFLRGRYVPVVDIGTRLGFREQPQSLEQSVMLLIESDDGTSTALAVDGIQDQRQVVIKGLEANYGHVDGIAAATILGDGRIALIVDPNAIVAGFAAAQQNAA